MTRKFPALFAGVLGGVTLPHKPEGSCSENHPYVLRVGDQAQYLKRVDKAGINRCIHYPIALHLTKAYEGLGLIIGNFPVAEAAVSQALSLPMFPEIGRAHV